MFFIIYRTEIVTTTRQSMNQNSSNLISRSLSNEDESSERPSSPEWDLLSHAECGSSVTVTINELLNFLQNLTLEDLETRCGIVQKCFSTIIILDRGFKNGKGVSLEKLLICKTHNDLEQLGITEAGQRMKLLKSMEDYGMNNPKC